MESSLNEDFVELDYDEPEEMGDSSLQPAETTSLPLAAGEDSHAQREESASPADRQEEEKEGPRCAICIHAYQNKTRLDHCFHAFCFSCIMTWFVMWLMDKDGCLMMTMMMMMMMIIVGLSHEHQGHPGPNGVRSARRRLPHSSTTSRARRCSTSISSTRTKSVRVVGKRGGLLHGALVSHIIKY
jgi:hypothetical protein